jgi:hypothetical protein
MAARKQEIMEQVKALLKNGKRLNATELEALSILGAELKSLKGIKGGSGMKRAVVVERKRIGKHVIAPVKRGWGGRGESNFDTYGHVIKGDISFASYAKKHPDCIVMIKKGVAKRMDETNGTGTVCVVYRVAANK